MTIAPEIIIFFLLLFTGLIGFIGQSMINRLDAIDEDLKELLIDHGTRISKNETEIHQLKAIANKHLI